MSRELSKLQSEFSKLDMSKIEEVFSLIESSNETAIEFAKNPDNFVKKHSGIDIDGHGLHFHIHVDDKTSPNDQILFRGDRLIFMSKIRLKKGLRTDILRAMQSELPVQSAASLSGYCSGCQKCAIAIVEWVE